VHGGHAEQKAREYRDNENRLAAQEFLRVMSERDANLRARGLLVTHGHSPLRRSYSSSRLTSLYGITLSSLRKVFLLLSLTFPLLVVLILPPVI